MLYLHEINQVRPGRLSYSAAGHDYLPIAERPRHPHGRLLDRPPGHGSWPETVAVWELDGYEHQVDITRPPRPEPVRRGLRDWDANLGEWVTRPEGMVACRRR